MSSSSSVVVSVAGGGGSVAHDGALAWAAGHGELPVLGGDPVRQALQAPAVVQGGPAAAVVTHLDEE